ncbi:hypothetical protein SDC9_113004 [bioreactor metagenome]|uniref:Uncharacterized protein n=1 Tax=bioreactor metagenome TaxID=1076179 RepID=A0A645BLI7_9ZZZZ
MMDAADSNFQAKHKDDMDRFALSARGYFTAQSSDHTMDPVDDPSVAVLYFGSRAAARNPGLRLARDALGHVLELMDIIDRQAESAQLVFQILPQGVDRDAALRHQHIHRMARRGGAQHLIHHDGQPGAVQRRYDHGQLGARRRIAVPPGAANDIAVGVRMHVDVEAGVDLGRPQHHRVQRIDRGAPGVRPGIAGGGYFVMPGVVPDRLHRPQIKALHVHQGFEVALLQHIHHIAGDAAQAKTARDTQPFHNGLQVLRHSQRGPAGPRLKGEAVPAQAAGFYHLRGVAGNGKPHRIPGDTRRARHNAPGIADAVHLGYNVHILLADGGGDQRIVLYMVCDQHHLAGKPGVTHRVTQRTAGGGAGNAVGVPHAVSRGGRDEGHIDAHPPGLDGLRPAAVAAEQHGL